MKEESEQAYRKALFILERRDYTETELQIKLREKEYTEESISFAIAKLKEYGLVDDRRFTEQYLRYHYEAYSRRVLSVKLLRKGITAELFDSVYQEIVAETEKYPEEEALKKAVRAAIRKAERKGYLVEALPPEEKRRIMSSLYRKGFSVRQINEELSKITVSDY